MKVLMEELNEIEDKEPIWKRPVIIILSLFLVLIIVSMSIPYYSVRLDPEPEYIALIDEVVDKDIIVEEDTTNDYLALVKPNDVVVKRAADKIISLSGCGSNKICHAKAIFYFVRDKFEYVSDPYKYEYVKSARESFVAGGGDCDDASVLLANLLEAVGIRTRFVFIPGHVYIQAYMPDALKKYRENNWVNLDATCMYCGFGEISYKSSDKEKRYLE